jgi:phospho-N-acetylmuramoyl-pentapeptide-transferase
MTGLLAFVLSALIAGLAGAPLIARFRAMALAQHAYEGAPKTHQVKTGTPTMGGVLFLPALLVALILRFDPATLALSVLTASCALIGSIDDLASIRGARNKGLSAKVKLSATVAAAALFIVLVAVWHLTPVSHLSVPNIAMPVAVWVLLSIFVLLASTHAVNLTDGLDGLAGGTMIPPLLVCALIAWAHGYRGVALFDLSLLGAIVGFLVYNRHPARLFMGDTGALALGGALAGSMILMGLQLLLPLLGAVFAVEALSVILQVASYKATKRRIFRMSPLHHHFELGGASESRVTFAFCCASTACALLALFVVEAR